MTKIEFLKYLSKGWFGSSQQHSIHAQLLKARGLNKLADKIMAESDEEWDEAKKVNSRLIELGETPVVELQEYPVITDIKEMLEYDFKDAAEALPVRTLFSSFAARRHHGLRITSTRTKGGLP